MVDAHSLCGLYLGTVAVSGLLRMKRYFISEGARVPLGCVLSGVLPKDFSSRARQDTATQMFNENCIDDNNHELFLSNCCSGPCVGRGWHRLGKDTWGMQIFLTFKMRRKTLRNVELHRIRIWRRKATLQSVLRFSGDMPKQECEFDSHCWQPHGPHTKSKECMRVGTKT